MSTKIYYAFRFPIDKLNSFIDLTRENALQWATNQVYEIMDEINFDKEPIPEWFNNDPDKINRWKRNKSFDKAIELCMEASKSIYREHADIECGLNIWVHEDKAYAIPINCEKFIKKIKFPKWVEDYSYWNNTDNPKDVSYEDWELRGETWEKINCGRGKSSHNARRLYHAFVDLSQGHLTGSWEIKKRIIKEA